MHGTSSHTLSSIIIMRCSSTHTDGPSRFPLLLLLFYLFLIRIANFSTLFLAPHHESVFVCVGRCVREGNDIFYLSLPANSLFGCCQYYYPSLDLELGPVNTLSEWVQSRTLVVERERQRATQDTGKHFPDTQWNDMARLGQVLTHGVLEYTTIQRFGPELRDGSPNSWQNTPARAQSKQLKLERSPLVLSVSMHEERFSVFVNGIFFMIRWIK